MNKQELIIRIEKIKYEHLHYNSPESMLLEQKHKILDLVKQLDEPQKPVVPKFVAEWIEYAKKKGDSLRGAFCPWELYGAEYIKANNWIDANQETFARAWLIGYEVEKEQFYEVVFREDEADRYLLMALGEKCYEIAPESENDGYRTQYFTEAEIKAIDERYWAFAVPVEEVAEG